MALETELSTYRENLEEFACHSGEFVLIHGEEVVEFFTAYEDAMKRGYQLFKLQPFMVKQIEAVETAHTITRLLFPASASKG